MVHAIHKFGRNDTVANGVWEDVWSPGGAYVWPQAAQVNHIVSSTAADTAAGAGALSVTIEGLSSSFEEVSETINTAGTSTAAGSVKMIRVNRAFVEDAGTYAGLVAGGNKGTINILTSTGGVVANIGVDATVGLGQTQVARFTIPLNKTGYVKTVELYVNSLKPADMAWFQRRAADDVAAPMKARRLVEYYDGVDGQLLLDHHQTPYGPFPEKTDLWFAAKGDGNATSVSADFEIVLYPQGQEPEFG